jgi:preprotein translocase subunit SecB
MAQFNLISQFLKDFSFESPNVPELFFAKENSQAKIDLNVDLQVKGADNNVYMVDLVAKLHSKIDANDKSLFLIECTYSGMVQVEDTKDEAELQQVLLIDIPTLLFPTVRALVARVTFESGFPPFAMQPIDFKKLYASKQQAAANA